jgi:tetratricopeptide (TPR) repeat protein
MKLPLAATALLLCLGGVARAQTAADAIALGDSAAAALDAQGALTHYEAAIKLDSANAEALWKAAREAVDLGEAAGFDHHDTTRDSLYKIAEQYANRAVQANPNSAAAHFTLAKALGRAALTLGSRERVKYAKRVRQEALEAIKLDSLDDGAWHVMGVWNAEIMRLNVFTRFFAKTLLGGAVFGEASWANAQRDLEHAVELQPKRIVHHLDLAQVYADVGDKTKAREQYELVLSLPATEYNDTNYKHEAEQALAKLR